MPYIGKQPLTGAFQMISVPNASATATYAMTKNSAAFFPASAEQLIVSLNGVIQQANNSFSVSGSNLIFSENLTANDTIDFVLCLGEVGNTVVPTDGSVDANKFSSSVSRGGSAMIRVNGSTLNENVTIASGERAMVSGDFTIGSNTTLTINGVLTVV